ncbi:peptidase S9 [Kordiimonas sediminis]|uniref:Peptidase S9 n=1 Tax=Kordiimonas sediminis TaxID=1735581 RepID=A0A919AR02_9PROT|nr:alpha/beta fold hydrolase [Kordiimonas sediminis]GHF19859.1 peptidase S9 [Kordiimonas sediminis]
MKRTFLKLLKHSLLASALAANFASPSVVAQDAIPLIPVEEFAQLPDFESPKLSPDGTFLAFSMDVKGRRHIRVQSLDGSEAFIIPPIDNADINRVMWANADRLLIVYRLTDRARGITTQLDMTRLAAIDKDGQNFAWIVKPRPRSKAGKDRISRDTGLIGQIQDNIIDLLPDEPNHILLSIDSDLNGRAEIRYIDIRDGSFREQNDGRDGVQRWYADANHEVKLGTGYNRLNDYKVYFKQANGDYLDLETQDWYQYYNVEGLTIEDDVIYATGPGEHGREALVKINVGTGQVIETLFDDEQYDAYTVIEHPSTGIAAGVSYTDDHFRYKYFDPELAKVQRTIDSALKGRVNRIINKARDKEIYIILSTTPTDPGVYFFYDRTAKKLNQIALHHNDIDPAHMGQTERVEIPTRDGETIVSYLTLPAGKSKTDALPTVVLVHGGPRARDDMDWDYWTQFLANRGYAVLRPNFRGSTGFGQAYFAKGYKQWGGIMQQDVTDATKWLIEEGISDQQKVCIAGASYGGYSALMGVIQEPGLYACAVSVNGVTNIPSMKNKDKRFIGGSSWTQSMVLEGADDKDISPYHLAGKTAAPVLLMASKDDARVQYKLSEAMHKELKKKKKKSTYVEIDDGGHNMVTAASRLIKLKEMEKFLAKHLK